MVALKNSPKAEPFEPETELSRPDSPELDEPDPDAKMLSPLRMPLSPESDEAGDRQALQRVGHRREQV